MSSRRSASVALALLGAVAMGLACQTGGGGGGSTAPLPGPAAQAPTESLEETTWELVTLGGAAPPEGIKRPPNLRLDPAEKRLIGFGGCNRVFGGYAAEGASLKLSPLGTTKMACLGPQMPLEKQFLDALERVTAWTISGSTLTLRAGEAEVATLRAVPPAP